MTRRSNPALPLTLLAIVVLGAGACDRIWPSSNDAGDKTVAAKPAQKPSQTVASLPAPPTVQPPPPVAPPPPPLPPQRMTQAQEIDFNLWIVKAYLGCWKPQAQPADSDPYVAQVRLAFKPDGSLARAPKLVNPPSDPALKPQAKSVLHAVQSCNPLVVPAQYRPFYEQWKTKTIHFNPQIAAR